MELLPIYEHILKNLVSPHFFANTDEQKIKNLNCIFDLICHPNITNFDEWFELESFLIKKLTDKFNLIKIVSQDLISNKSEIYYFKNDE